MGPNGVVRQRNDLPFNGNQSLLHLSTLRTSSARNDHVLSVKRHKGSQLCHLYSCKSTFWVTFWLWRISLRYDSKNTLSRRDFPHKQRDGKTRIHLLCSNKEYIFSYFFEYEYWIFSISMAELSICIWLEAQFIARSCSVEEISIDFWSLAQLRQGKLSFL